MRPTQFWLALILGALLVMVGFWAGLSWDASDREVPVSGVHCPVEDDCEVDFRDGAWWLRTSDHGQGPGPWVRVSR